MHIAFVISDLKGGGAQKMMINLANMFARKGYQTDIVLFNGTGIYLDMISDDVRIVDLKMGRTFKAISPLSSYIKNHAPDILMSALFHVNLAAIIARILSGNKKAKLIISERNNLTRRLSEFSFFKRFAFKKSIHFLYPLADKIIGISNGVCEDLKKIISTHEKGLVQTIYNPVVSEDFEEKLLQDVAPIFPKKCGVKLITSGRLVVQKDYPTLLRTLAVYKEKYGAVHLVVLGDGSLKDELLQYVKELGVENNVTFFGFVSNPLAYMKQADIFVISSAWEGFCNVIVEALYCGLKVVSTDCPSGPSEILKEGKYGALVPVGEASSLCEAIYDVSKKDSDKEKQKSRSLDFTAEKISDEFRVVFEGLINSEK